MGRQLALARARPSRPRSSTPSITPSGPVWRATALRDGARPDGRRPRRTPRRGEHRPDHPVSGQRQHQRERQQRPVWSAARSGTCDSSRPSGPCARRGDPAALALAPTGRPAGARARAGARRPGRLRPDGFQPDPRSSRAGRGRDRRSPAAAAERLIARPTAGLSTRYIDRLDRAIRGVAAQDLLAPGATLGGELELERYAMPGWRSRAAGRGSADGRGRAGRRRRSRTPNGLSRPSGVPSCERIRRSETT